MAYATDRANLFARAGSYVSEILKGAKPAATEDVWDVSDQKGDIRLSCNRRRHNLGSLGPKLVISTFVARERKLIL